MQGTITLHAETDNQETFSDLVESIKTLAPYMLDNVVVTSDLTEVPENDGSVTLDIAEVATYRVTASSVYEAVRVFLRDPNKYLVAVEGRDMTNGDGSPLTPEQADEVERAEGDS